MLRAGSAAWHEDPAERREHVIDLHHVIAHDITAQIDVAAILPADRVGAVRRCRPRVVFDDPVQVAFDGLQHLRPRAATIPFSRG